MMQLGVGVALISILFCAPVACGTDVSLGSGPGAPGDAGRDVPEDMTVGGTIPLDGRADIPSEVAPVRGVDGGQDTGPMLADAGPD